MGFYALSARAGRSRHLAYVIGVLLGDGCVYRMRGGKPHPRTGLPTRDSWRVELAVTDAAFAATFADALACTVKRPESRRPLVMPVHRSGRAAQYRVAVASRGFGEWWQDRGRAHAELWPYIEPYPEHFLRGWYDSEGSTIRGGYRIFTTATDTMRLGVDALKALGMSGTPVVFRPAGTVVQTPAGPVTSTVDLLMLAPTPSAVFRERVGSSIPRKR